MLTNSYYNYRLYIKGSSQSASLAEKRGWVGMSSGAFFGLDFLPARLAPVGRGYFLFVRTFIRTCPHESSICVKCFIPQCGDKKEKKNRCFV
jgi:hypothetical protein